VISFSIEITKKFERKAENKEVSKERKFLHDKNEEFAFDDAIEVVSSTIEHQHPTQQQKFRMKLLQHYKKCVFTGETIKEALEAADIS